MFIDETCVKASVTPFRDRNLRRRRFNFRALVRKREASLSIARLRCDELSTAFVVKESVYGDAFMTYVQMQPAPTLRQGDCGIHNN